MALDLVCEMSWVRPRVKKRTKHVVETPAMDNRPSLWVDTQNAQGCLILVSHRDKPVVKNVAAKKKSPGGSKRRKACRAPHYRDKDKQPAGVSGHKCSYGLAFLHCQHDKQLADVS